jgi:hypothetical protein
MKHETYGHYNKRNSEGNPWPTAGVRSALILRLWLCKIDHRVQLNIAYCLEYFDYSNDQSQTRKCRLPFQSWSDTTFCETCQINRHICFSCQNFAISALPAIPLTPTCIQFSLLDVDGQPSRYEFTWSTRAGRRLTFFLGWFYGWRYGSLIFQVSVLSLPRNVSQDTNSLCTSLPIFITN